MIPEIKPIMNPPATSGTNPPAASLPYDGSLLDNLSIVFEILSINTSVSFAIAFAYWCTKTDISLPSDM